MTVELYLVPLIFAYALIAGYIFSILAKGGFQEIVITLIKSIFWLPVMAFVISAHIAALLLGDDVNHEG